MSYAIVRNEKLTRANVNGSYVHNDRRSKGHTNKNIDPTRTHLNFYFKKNEQTYIKEFDKLREERNLQGHIKSNSIIMCEMMFTSDQAFFDKIGEKETRRYFEECYKFTCNYKNLGEENIISSVVHLDEEAPHMHLMYVPVVHTKDKEGKDIEKICAKDFWKGRDSYRQLQNAFYKHVKSKGFDLERGLPVEETGAKHEKIEDLKKLTNYENTKKILKNIKLELPEVPDINDIKLIKLNKEKVENEIIIVCSKNKAKNDAVIEVMKNFFKNFEVESLETNSGVSETPIGDNEGITGCLNRIKDAIKQKNDGDLYIAMEGILSKTLYGTFLCGWTVMYDKNENDYYFGCSAKIKVPDIIIEKTNKSQRLSDVVAEHVGSTGDEISNLGTNGLLTNGVYTRTDEFIDSITCAISSKFKKIK